MRFLLVFVLAFTALACDKTIHEVRLDSNRQTPTLAPVTQNPSSVAIAR